MEFKKREISPSHFHEDSVTRVTPSELPQVVSAESVSDCQDLNHKSSDFYPNSLCALEENKEGDVFQDRSNGDLILGNIMNTKIEPSANTDDEFCKKPKCVENEVISVIKRASPIRANISEIPDAKNALNEIEENFERLRRAVQQERAKYILKDSHKIQNGTHPEYIAGMCEIEERFQRRKKAHEKLRRYAIDAAVREFNSNKLQAERTFVESRIIARRARIIEANRIRHEVELEKRKLDDNYSGYNSIVEPLLGKDVWDKSLLARRRNFMRLLADDFDRIQDEYGDPALVAVPLTPEEIQKDLTCFSTGSSQTSRC